MVLGTSTKYLDELIFIFRKARPEGFVFQDEEVKNCLITGLPSETLLEVQSFLDLSAEEIASKYDLLGRFRAYICHRDRESLAYDTRKSVGNDEISIINELEQILAYKDGDHKNKYKDETYTYCNKKDQQKLSVSQNMRMKKLNKLAEECTAAMVDHLSTYNKEAMDTIMNKLESLFLKRKG